MLSNFDMTTTLMFFKAFVDDIVGLQLPPQPKIFDVKTFSSK
jgi:hypothetical protein